jgi:NitT/TauT family transport system substrate-binding protein
MPHLALSRAAVAVLCGLITVLAACGGDDDGPDAAARGSEELPVVKIQAFSGGSSNVALKLIDENGFDTKNGFEGDYHYLDPDAANQFFFQGRSDVAFDIDTVGVAIARNRGIEVTSIGGVVANHLCIATKPDAGFDSPEDLAGKRVGHYGLDSGGTVSLAILMQEGYDIDIMRDWELVESDPNGLLALLHRGDVDAIVSIEPNISKERVTGRSECMTPRFTEMWKEIAGGMLYNSTIAAHNSWLQENPELAKQIVQAWSDALAWLNDNPDALGRAPYDEVTGIEDPEALELYAEAIRTIPLFSDSWTADDIAAQEAFVDLAAEQGTLLEENPGGATTALE